VINDYRRSREADALQQAAIAEVGMIYSQTNRERLILQNRILAMENALRNINVFLNRVSDHAAVPDSLTRQAREMAIEITRLIGEAGQ